MEQTVAYVKLNEQLVEIAVPQGLSASDIGSIRVTTQSFDANDGLLNETEQTILPNQTAKVPGLLSGGASAGFDVVKMFVELFESADGSGPVLAETNSAFSADQIGTDHAHDHSVITDNNAFLMAMGEGSRIEIHYADTAKKSWTWP